LGSARPGQVRVDGLACLRTLEHQHVRLRHGRRVGVGAGRRLLDGLDLAPIGLDDLGRPGARCDLRQQQDDPDEQQSRGDGQDLVTVGDDGHRVRVAHPLLRRGLDKSHSDD
jgi:hypothetical protein